VEAMIKVAAGERLPFGQRDIRLHGWAMETRLYAEDPYRNFLPSIGRLTTYREPPADMKGVRIDTGVVEGSQISLHYDPMIAKLITHGATREIAMDKQIAALDRYTIRGIGHNRDFLSVVMQHPRFREGARVTTGFIAEEYPQGFEGALLGPALALDFILSASIIHVLRVQQERQISGQLNGSGVNGSSADVPADWVCVLEGKATNLSVRRAGEDWQVRVGTHTYSIATA
jgi:propionyl-CoA carboxylase alpha chain